MRTLCVLAALLGWVSSVSAEDLSATLKIAHGEAITAAVVGPKAAGYRSLKAFSGSTIKDGKTYTFAREIEAPATYDGFAINGPHLLIEGAAFSSSLDIYSAKPVVLRGVSVRPEADGAIAVLVRPGAGDVYVLWSDIGGAAAAKTAAGIALRGTRATVYRSHISNSADGLSIAASGVRISENLIETRAASEGDHNDAIQLLGAPQHITIARNKILNRNPQTSCLCLLGASIDVQSNYLSGGGWTIYGGANNNGHGKGAASGVSVTDTIFGRDYFAKSGHFGPVSYWDPANSWRDNRFQGGGVVQP